jgi:hemerythrin-like domain-containing protein
MKATELLKQQHREVMALFKELENTDASRGRRRLVDEIAKHLEAHTTIEEEIFYPAVHEAGTQKAEEMVLEAIEEHHVVKLVLEELPSVDPGAENFEAKMMVLKELVEHHVEEEHSEMFPLAEKKLGKDTLQELGERLEARSEELLRAQQSRKRA